jgi:hypothetical protein
MGAGLSLCSSSEMTFSMYGADRKQTFGRDSNFTKKPSLARVWSYGNLYLRKDDFITLSVCITVQ